MPRFELIATTTFGLETVVSRELEKLGYTELRVLDGKVHFSGDERDIARCNMWLRSADRLLIKVGEFQAPDFGALFDKTVDLPWSDYIPVDAKFPVAGRSVQSRLHAVPAVQGAVKKAIVESLKKKYNRFRFEETGAEFPVEVSLLRDVATLTIDTSGDAILLPVQGVPFWPKTGRGWTARCGRMFAAKLRICVCQECQNQLWATTMTPPPCGFVNAVPRKPG